MQAHALHHTLGLVPHKCQLLVNGLCGSYSSKPERTISSGLPTIHPERAGCERG